MLRHTDRDRIYRKDRCELFDSLIDWLGGSPEISDEEASRTFDRLVDGVPDEVFDGYPFRMLKELKRHLAARRCEAESRGGELVAIRDNAGSALVRVAEHNSRSRIQ